MEIRQRDTVIGQKGNLQLTADSFVVIDLVANHIDRANNIFREFVTWRGFRGEDEDPGHEMELRVLQ